MKVRSKVIVSVAVSAALAPAAAYAADPSPAPEPPSASAVVSAAPRFSGAHTQVPFPTWIAPQGAVKAGDTFSQGGWPQQVWDGKCRSERRWLQSDAIDVPVELQAEAEAIVRRVTADGRLDRDEDNREIDAMAAKYPGAGIRGIPAGPGRVYVHQAPVCPTPTPAPSKSTGTPTPAPSKSTGTPTPAPSKSTGTPTPAPSKSTGTPTPPLLAATGSVVDAATVAGAAIAIAAGMVLLVARRKN